MRYKNWKMRQISSVMVTDPFLSDIMTLLVPKTTVYNTLDKFFIFTMKIHVSIFVVAFSPNLCINLKKKNQWYFIIVMHLKINSISC